MGRESSWRFRLSIVCQIILTFVTLAFLCILVNSVGSKCNRIIIKLIKQMVSSKSIYGTVGWVLLIKAVGFMIVLQLLVLTGVNDNTYSTLTSDEAANVGDSKLTFVGNCCITTLFNGLCYSHLWRLISNLMALK